MKWANGQSMLYEKSLESRLSAKNCSVFLFLFFFLERSYMAYNTTKQVLNIYYKHNLLIKPYNSLLATFTIAKLKSEKNPAIGERDLSKCCRFIGWAIAYYISHSSAVCSGCLKCLKITAFPCLFFFPEETKRRTPIVSRLKKTWNYWSNIVKRAHNYIELQIFILKQQDYSFSIFMK